MDQSRYPPDWELLIHDYVFSFLAPPLTLMLSPSKLNQNSRGCTSNTLGWRSRWAALGLPFFLTSMTTLPYNIPSASRASEHTFMFPFIILVPAIKNASPLFVDILTNLHDSENYHFPLSISWRLWSKRGCCIHCTFTEHSAVTLMPCFVFYWWFVCSLPPWRIECHKDKQHGLANICRNWNIGNGFILMYGRISSGYC